MNYNELTETMRNKFAGYTIAQCDFAIRDCHATLKELAEPHDSLYSRKLWAEIDAARDRKMKLQGV